MSHNPRKRFGQHFLHDPAVIQRIVTAINPRAENILVEIGPGEGAITLPLLQATGCLHVVELDRDLIDPLQYKAREAGELTVHNADALRFDFCKLAGSGMLRVVGNLPYNISTPLLFHLLEQSRCISDMHFMLQKEVVDRLAADPGSGQYGRLSVMIQYRCEVTPLFTIGAGAFRPPPRVESAFVKLRPYRTPPVAVRDEAVLAAVVQQAFSQRRKTLRNVLRNMIDASAMQALGIDPALRAEMLGIREFAALANHVATGRKDQ
ncbi:MAG: 16S rRNA (adenine(1518)-N(6)/adenine(1519)-N(6))-dimethyltransferase RsmA [Gammaproteobacteria bacterium]|nr:MAG: 16S rRNA (adenine(1518)-N(6)/adenine(1519)-N(6))-dimethyltransferase RsmA [Gammaproteobacteria bacterium]